MKIAIGITTYNRLDDLKQLLEDLSLFPPSRFSVDFFIADDGSTDGTVEFLKTTPFSFHSGMNQGIPWNKNKIICRFMDYDYVFLLEDDLKILKPFWADFFIDALKSSGENHLCYVPEYLGKEFKLPKINHEFKGFSIIENFGASGVFMVFTGKALRLLGGFDTRFVKYGHEHSNMTERVYRSGLNRFAWPHLRGSEEYLSLRHTASTVRQEEALLLMEMNQYILYYWGYSLNAGVISLYCSPYPQPDLKTERLKASFGLAAVTDFDNLTGALEKMRALSGLTPEANERALVVIHPSNTLCRKIEVREDITLLHTDTLCGATHKNMLLAHFKNQESVVFLSSNFTPHTSGWLSKLISMLNTKTFCCGFISADHYQPRVMEIAHKGKIRKYPEYAAIAVSHQALKILGGFDERFIGCGMEEEEYLERAVKAQIGSRQVLSDYLKQKYFTISDESAFRGIFDLIPEKNMETELLLNFMQGKGMLDLFRPFHDSGVSDDKL